jgi:hypothetical protein
VKLLGKEKKRKEERKKNFKERLSRSAEINWRFELQLKIWDYPLGAVRPLHRTGVSLLSRERFL